MNLNSIEKEDFFLYDNTVMYKTILNPTITTKTNSFPKGLIYKIPQTNKYKLADSNGKLVGEMNLLERFCQNSSFYNAEPYGRTLHIYSLTINEEEWGKGWGSYFLDFAKKESYRRGCKGRCSLVAHNPGKPPHVFYKKNGFITTKKDLNKFLDECIEIGITPHFLHATDMFIPIKKFMIEPSTKPKQSSWQKFWDGIISIFS